MRWPSRTSRNALPSLSSNSIASRVPYLSSRARGASGLPVRWRNLPTHASNRPPAPCPPSPCPPARTPARTRVCAHTRKVWRRGRLLCSKRASPAQPGLARPGRHPRGARGHPPGVPLARFGHGALHTGSLSQRVRPGRADSLYSPSLVPSLPPSFAACPAPCIPSPASRLPSSPLRPALARFHASIRPISLPPPALPTLPPRLLPPSLRYSDPPSLPPSLSLPLSLPPSLPPSLPLSLPPSLPPARPPARPRH